MQRLPGSRDSRKLEWLPAKEAAAAEVRAQSGRLLSSELPLRRMHCADALEGFAAARRPSRHRSIPRPELTVTPKRGRARTRPVPSSKPSKDTGSRDRGFWDPAGWRLLAWSPAPSARGRSEAVGGGRLTPATMHCSGLTQM